MSDCPDLVEQGMPTPHVRRTRRVLGDGAVTTVHVAAYPLAATRLRVARLPATMALERWCREHGVGDALVGGFYVRQPQVAADPLLHGSPLGELRIDGVTQDTVAFDAPWGMRRACVHSDGTHVRIARRAELAGRDGGDLLQAGPLLVRGGATVVGDDEGFSQGSGQFDQDITLGRHPRAALGCSPEALLAVACDGRTDAEAGLTLPELAELLVELGADAALNLDGGGSTSLVCGGRLRNVPREGGGVVLAGGRPVATALVFEPR